MSVRPFEDTISGVADANGNVSIPWSGLRGTWGSLILIAQGQGFPRWTVVRNGRPVAVGRGPNAPIQLPPLSPQQPCVLRGSNLTPGSNATGDIIGLVSDIGLDELPLAAPTAGVIAMDTASPQQPVPGFPASVARDGFVHDLGTVPLVSGTHSIGFTFPTPSAIAQLQVIGNNSGIDYASRSLAGVTNTVTVKVYSGIDSAIDIKVTTNAGAGATLVDSVFILDAQVVTLDSAEPVGTFLENNLGNVIAYDTGVGGRLNLAVSERYANPAPWQAPLITVFFDVNLNNNSSTLRAGVGGQTITVHGWTNTFSAIAAAVVYLESDDAVPGSAVYDIWNGVGTVGPFRGDAKGVPGPVGSGLRIRNPFAAAIVCRGAVQLTQS